MAEKPDRESQTEQATEKKVHDALDRGNVPVSREATIFTFLLGLLLILILAEAVKKLVRRRRKRILDDKKLPFGLKPARAGIFHEQNVPGPVEKCDRTGSAADLHPQVVRHDGHGLEVGFHLERHGPPRARDDKAYVGGDGVGRRTYDAQDAVGTDLNFNCAGWRGEGNAIGVFVERGHGRRRGEQGRRKQQKQNGGEFHAPKLTNPAAAAKFNYCERLIS